MALAFVAQRRVVLMPDHMAIICAVVYAKRLLTAARLLYDGRLLRHERPVSPLGFLLALLSALSSRSAARRAGGADSWRCSDHSAVDRIAASSSSGLLAVFLLVPYSSWQRIFLPTRCPCYLSSILTAAVGVVAGMRWLVRKLRASQIGTDSPESPSPAGERRSGCLRTVGRAVSLVVRKPAREPCPRRLGRPSPRRLTTTGSRGRHCDRACGAAGRLIVSDASASVSPSLSSSGRSDLARSLGSPGWHSGRGG